MAQVEKLGQEDAYVSDCVAALRVEIECAVSLLLHQVTTVGDLPRSCFQALSLQAACSLRCITTFIASLQALLLPPLS